MEPNTDWELERERVRALLADAGLPVFEVTVRAGEAGERWLPEHTGWWPLVLLDGSGLRVVPQGDTFDPVRAMNVLREAGYTMAPLPAEGSGAFTVTGAPAP
jgi:hypothetical protein